MNSKSIRFLSPWMVTLVSLIVANVYGPDMWIMKYDINGQAAQWSTKSHFLLFMLGFSGLVSLLIFTLSEWLSRPENLKWVNLPHREHWMQPENHVLALALVRSILFAVLCFVNFVSMALLTLSWSQKTGWIANVILFSILCAAGILFVWILRRSKPQ